MKSLRINKTKSVLVVDDNGINRLLPGMILRPFGWSVYESEGGRDALEILKNTQISCVLLDLAMPEVNGLEILQLLRNDASLDHLKVIAYTSFAHVMDISRLMELGFDDVLIKPLTSAKLLDLLEVR